MQLDLLDAAHNIILASQSYEEFAKRLRESNCQRCALHGSRKNIVIDRGNPNSKLMIISERPGANEDADGRAFVGRAGELLDKIFAAIGLDTDKDMLIVNIVKCLPPVERAPLTSEAETCLPYLNKQIELMKPKIVILLGAVALKYISPEHAEFPMEKEAGNFITLSKYPGIQFMVLYHPAFLLRDPRKKKDMWEHVKKLRDYLKRQE